MHIEAESVSTESATPLDSTKLTVSSLTALNQVANFYLDPANLRSGRSEGIKQFLLAFVALTGAGLYIVPSKFFADKHYPDQLGLSVSYIIGTSTPALVVLYNSTEIFLTQRASLRPPRALAAFMNPSDVRLHLRQDIFTLLGAAISAAPLATISLAYPVPGFSLALTILQTAVVEIDNTVLHFLPIQLAMGNPVYRLPFLPFEKAYSYYKKRNMTDEQLNQEAAEQLNQASVMQTKFALFEGLNRVQRKIALDGVRKKAWGYEVILPAEVRSLAEGSKVNKLDVISTYKVSNRQRAKKPYEKNLKLSLQIAGAFWIAAGGAGYLAGTYNRLSDVMDSRVGAGILAAPAMYFLGVLFTFYGQFMAGNCYDYLTSWGEEDVKIPVEYKLYPKMAMMFLLFSLYSAAFSFAAADELIEDNFDNEALSTTLTWLAQTSIPFLSVYAIMDFCRTALRKYALYFNNRDENAIVKLNAMLEAFKTGLMNMEAEQFKSSLNSMSDAQFENLLGMPKKKCAILEEEEKEAGTTSFVALTREEESTPLPDSASTEMSFSRAPSPSASSSQHSLWKPKLSVKTAPTSNYSEIGQGRDIAYTP
jgi:hypothetical protein